MEIRIESNTPGRVKSAVGRAEQQLRRNIPISGTIIESYGGHRFDIEYGGGEITVIKDKSRIIGGTVRFDLES